MNDNRSLNNTDDYLEKYSGHTIKIKISKIFFFPLYVILSIIFSFISIGMSSLSGALILYAIIQIGLLLCISYDVKEWGTGTTAALLLIAVLLNPIDLIILLMI